VAGAKPWCPRAAGNGSGRSDLPGFKDSKARARMGEPSQRVVLVEEFPSSRVPSARRGQEWVKLSRAHHLPTARMRGRCSPVSGLEGYAVTADGVKPFGVARTYLVNSRIASSARTPPVMVIGTNGAFAAISALEIMI
jgi:hypothetical protein